jgi:2-aminoadipate transaminase
MPSSLTVNRDVAGIPPGSARETKDSIPFDSGHAFPGILPDLRSVAERALAVHRTEMLQYGQRHGLPEMRTWISAHLKNDGADVLADEVLVVNGAKHGIDLICRLLLKPGDTIIVTAPTYYTALPIFRGFGAEILNVGQDAEGMSLEEVERAVDWLSRNGRPPPKFIYDIPDFHNPTGITMSCSRRVALLDVARRHGMHVVEDSPYRHLRFEGENQPSLKSLDSHGVVLNVGTFSKILAPGLRIGWVAGPRKLIDQMAQLKSDGGTSPLVQRLIVDFFSEARSADHTRLARDTYRNHRDRMVAALGREIPAATVVVPDGGYYLWVTLPDDMSGDELTKRAGELGVTILSGSKFFTPQARGFSGGAAATTNNVRLAFSHAAPAEIDEGIHRLAEAYRSLRG